RGRIANPLFVGSNPTSAFFPSSMKPIFWLVCARVCLAAAVVSAAGEPYCRSELIFPLEHWHHHGSCIVETPDGDLLVCWFHGSGERQADDVKVEGARLRKGAVAWSPRFTMADTPG